MTTPTLSTLAIACAAPSPACYKLFTNSLVLQRQRLHSLIIWHPLPLSLTSFFFTLQYYVRPLPLHSSLLLYTGIVICLLSLLRRVTDGYVSEAERLATSSAYEENFNAEEVVVVTAQWGEKVIGVCAIRRGRGVWGWCVEEKYRGLGIGREILVLAVREARKSWLEAEEEPIQLAERCILSYRIQGLPKIFYRKFDEDEARARKTVAEVVAEVVEEGQREKGGKQR